MDGHAFMNSNTSASPSTQYEVRNWFFGRGHVAQAGVSYSHRDGGVRKGRSGGGSGRGPGEDGGEARPRPRRHSSYHGWALEKEKQERDMLKRGHRRVYSHGHHLSTIQRNAEEDLQDGLRKWIYAGEKDAGNRDNRHSRTSPQRNGQGQRPSVDLQVLKAERNSVASGTGSGDTLAGSTAATESLSPSPTRLRFSAGSFWKARPHSSSPSPTRTHSSAASFSASSYTAPNSACPTNLTTPTSQLLSARTSLNRRSTHSAASSKSVASSHPTMDDKSRVHKALNAFRQSTSKRKEEERCQDDNEADHGNTSHRLRPQRSLAEIRRRLHLGQSGVHRNLTQMPHSPPRPPLKVPRRHASLHNSGHGSLRNNDALLSPDRPHAIAHSSQDTHGSIDTGHQPAADDDDEEELDPAFLGSFDYHNFLCRGSTRKTALIMSPISTTQPAAPTKTHSSVSNMDELEHSSPQGITIPSTSTSARGEPVSTSTQKQTTQQNLKAKKSLPLLERRSQRLQGQFAGVGLAVKLPPHQPSPEALRSQDAASTQETRPQRLTDFHAWENTPIATNNNRVFPHLKESFTAPNTVAAISSSTANIPVLMGCYPFPGRFTSQQRLPSTPREASAPSALSNSPPYSEPSKSQSQIPQQSPSPVHLATVPGSLSCVHQESPPPGPAGSISYKEIDPEKLKPFIGPLTKQQPPPIKPLPHPPVARRLEAAQNSLAKAKDATSPALTTSSKLASEAMTSSKQSVQNTESVKDKTLTADQTDGSLETKNGQTSIKNKRTLLRKKVSTLFGEEKGAAPASRTADTDHSVTSMSTYRPISMNSLDADDNSFSDIFDDVFNAARDSASDAQRSAGRSINSVRPSLSATSEASLVAGSAPRVSITARRTIQPASRNEVVDRLATRLGMTDSASRAAILAALAEVSPFTAPPLTHHPAIRSDLPLQARLGMITDSTHEVGLSGSRGRTAHGENTATLNPNHGIAPGAMAGLPVLPLNVGRQRPTQVAVSSRHASRSTVAALEPLTGFTTRSLASVSSFTKGQDDVDICPAFDRTVDMTWYRFAKDLGGGVRESSLPLLPTQFDALSTVFMVKYSRGCESKSTAYDHLRRFAYFELDGPLRFKIMEKLLEDYRPGKPVLLNHSRQASPAWADDAFATLWQVFGPLQNAVWACPRLRADVMTALFMTQPFHVIFSPFVKPITQPLPTKWLFKYLYFMQDVRVELDMTKLGFGYVWQSTGLSTRLWDIGNLVHVFVDEMLKRDPRTNPMGQLTIHCRRFFGYRQGDNPHRGDVNFYKAPAGEDDEQKPGNHPKGQPWNYGRKPPSFPPSANNPSSGHRRHHTGGSDRVPFLHEGHLSVANPFHKLIGRVCSVRMCGMSEDWSMRFLDFWPKSEYDKIPKENFGLHIDRYTPSRHSYAAPGHAIFLDYGMRAGIHRFPPLPDSEPMVCTVYDDKNDVFLEVGSGNILTVKEGDGVEIIARSRHPPMPKSDLPFRGGSPVSLTGITVPPSRIPLPIGTTISPTMQAMRKGTPQKALQLLGLENGDESVVTPSASPTLQGDEDGDLVTPTVSRVSSIVTHTLRRQISTELDANNNQLSQLASDRCSSSTTASKGMSTKKSYLGLMNDDRRKPSN